MLSRRALLIAFAAAPLAARAQTPDFATLAAQGAEERARKPEIYDPAYVRIPYPMGDVPDDRGVCADTLIRAFRAAGADLQRLVHEDMKRAFAAYPALWSLKHTDTNIDHRRVPNLETFFTRAGASLPLNADPTLYLPGDVVSWRLPGNLPHIGVVSTKISPFTRQPLLVHNIGAGSQIEDVLFAWPQRGWFRYRPTA